MGRKKSLLSEVVKREPSLLSIICIITNNDSCVGIISLKLDASNKKDEIYIRENVRHFIVAIKVERDLRDVFYYSINFLPGNIYTFCRIMAKSTEKAVLKVTALIS